ncbi:uncharacterized protein Dana_GF20719 [Drosophila ananassae]|uniref:Uncharacterized protein n=1 Tax=Drosophila ananassae TaxID=7217 RepID=B3N1P2_DROAN|nr:uncharacterized protein LOC6503412 [Drosophila ananassae]EDV34011.1 uncharacterized protein Dana_GF20719 [Drosophila ananassae]
MVNIHSFGRIMANRCTDLIRTRKDSFQIRHYTRYYPRPSTIAQYVPEHQKIREREKSRSYIKNKSRSMWELDGGRAQISTQEDQMRLDENQYRPRGIKQRMYDCTWDNYPESVAAKHPNNVVHVEPHPRRRRSQEERPNTAKACDDDALVFMSQWDNNLAMINRNRFSKATGQCPASIVTPQMRDALLIRKRQFFY